VAGGEGNVEVCGLGHVPVGRKFHSDSCVRERCGRCANARRSEEARGNYSRILYPGTVNWLTVFRGLIRLRQEISRLLR
jgi:hypothetical protein